MEIKYEYGEVAVSIVEGIRTKLLGFRQNDCKQSESGGLLLGRTNINGNTVIKDITKPMSNDEQNRFFFKRKDQKHLDEVKKANEKCLYFKGNWHTHPQKNPTPSWVDIISWKKAMRNSRPGDSEFIFFVIVGTEELSIWCGNMKSRKIEKMTRY